MSYTVASLRNKVFAVVRKYICVHAFNVARSVFSFTVQYIELMALLFNIASVTLVWSGYCI